MRLRRSLPSIAVWVAFLTAAPAVASEKVVIVYTARHYPSDDEMYQRFTALTGIRVNHVDGKEDELLERIRREGAHGAADVFITVDAARLGEAEALGVFAPIQSKVLERRIPASLRTRTWASFSRRARLIVYAKASLAPAEVQDYEDLARPGLKGKVCVRSGTHPYDLSLGSALIAYFGEARTEAWARGVVANLARAPKGGDTDQLRAVAAGECQVALVNSYYLARLMASDRPEDQEVVRKVGFVWPNQRSLGVHVNVSGGGLLRTAPHPAAGLRFLEYLALDEGQAAFADANYEWPAVATVHVRNKELLALGEFRSDPIDVTTLSRNVALARKVYERAGWR